MKHYSSIPRLLLAAVTALVAWSGAVDTAHAATTIAVRKCSIFPCDSALSLKNEARAAYSNLPIGSIVFVSSQQYPLSAFVRICPGPRGGKDACLITSGDLGAVELDNRVYSRAAEIQPFDIPIDIAPSATQALPEIVEHWPYGRYLQFTLRYGVNPWHNLFSPSNWVWLEFHDTRTGENYRVYTGDRITVRFADGSSAQLQMQGIGPSGHFFRFLPESIRLANGEPIAQLQPPPAVTAGAGFSVTPPWVSGAFGESLPFGYCAFMNSHCQFNADGSVFDCFFRREQFPCG